MSKIKEAVKIIADAGIPVHEQAYGFSISHPELAGSSNNFAECGLDNDFSISISVRIDEDPPVAWFFRFDYFEMALFITESYRRAGSNPSRETIISQMRLVDVSYDYDALDARLPDWGTESNADPLTGK